jgi:DNA-binding transcriptional regulator YiaG
MAEAARQLGIPYRTYQDWELGNREPRPSVRGMLTQVLKLHTNIESAEKRREGKKATR